MVDRYIIEMNYPKDFRSSNPDNILNEMDIAFENVVSALEEVGVNYPKKLTVFEFNQRVQYFESKRKPGKNHPENG